MDRRGATVCWLGILCLMALGTEATWTERKAVFYNVNERIMDRMLRTMNESVNPCKDFHKYSSGRYGEGFDVKPNFILVEALEEQINPKFHHLFEKLKNRSHKPGSMKEKLFRLYNACEAARTENRSSNIFLDVMRPDVNLSWPLYMPEGRKWPKEQFQWLATLARLYRYGLRNFLIQVSLRVDSEDNRNYMYAIERPIMYLPGRRFLNSKIEKIRAWGVPDEAINKLELKIYISTRSTSVNWPISLRMSLQELETEHGISLMEFFEVAFDRKIDPNTQMLVDIGYLKMLQEIMNYDDQETVANYLMEGFGNFMASCQDGSKYQCVRAVRTSMKAACEQLYEKHILGETQELESEVQRVFEAIRKQFKQRLEANRMNLSTSYISYLQNKLETTTLNVGVLPKKKKWDNYLYDKLEFDIDDDFATMQLKAMDVLSKSEELFLDKLDKVLFPVVQPGHTIEFGNERTIFIPYDHLVEPFFSIHSHDVFKVSMLGYIIAEQLQKALYPKYLDFDCQHYIEYIGLLDDKQIYWDQSECYSRIQVDNFNWWGLHLVLLNIVHDAYFSPDSGFSQVQPDFTSKPLKELFFLNIAQNIAANKYYWFPGVSAPRHSISFNTGIIYNPVFKMPAYAEAFNCSTSDYS